MSKVKQSTNGHYELLYIISNKFTEDEAAEVVEKVKKAISAQNGDVTYEENWGKKKLAYQINGFSHGYYRLAEFDLERVKLAAVDRYLRLSNDIIRYQIVTKKVKTEEEIKQDKFIEQKLAAKAAVEAEKEEQSEKEKKTEKKKVDLKELDEKLDKILEGDNLL